MPFGEIRLFPGVNVEKTPTANEAGISQSQLIRFRDGLVQKYGGWKRFYPFALNGAPRDMHAWQDLNQVNHLSVGTTTQLNILTNGNLADITPQTFKSDFSPAIQTTANSTTIIITDPNINTATVYDSILFNTPIWAGGLILSGGPYIITQVNGATQYEITWPTAAADTNTIATNNTTANGNPTLHFASVPTWVIAGMQIVDLTTPSAIPANTVVLSTGVGTVTMSNNATGAGVGNGDNIVFTMLPRFEATSGSAVVKVDLAGHPFTAPGVGVNFQVNFPIATTVSNLTIQGTYTISSVASVSAFNITLPIQASTTTTVTMNGGNVELVYYIQLGPPPAGSGYGLGGYGSGGYGTGAGAGTVQEGTEIDVTDWTTDNWGEILMACPANGGIYTYDPTQGFLNAGIITTAPAFNGGIFVSMTYQILMAWGSTQQLAIGAERDPMLIRWSDLGDFTDFTPVITNQAGAYRIPVGSTIRGGMAFANQNLFWTDLDLWYGYYIYPPLVFGFNKLGAGMGAISSHAMQQLRGVCYWMGTSNFYRYDGSTAAAMPCPVWDFVFQNLNMTFQANVRAMPNTPFNEVGWEFPSLASTNGECDSYVKFNVTEQGGPWDYGMLPRSAWIDQTIFGPPIGATPTGIVYQHETTPDADGAPLMASFTTGYFYISQGEDFAFVDQIYPDFKWGVYPGTGGAQIQISVNAVNYETDTPIVYGPYVVSQMSPQWISTRIRARQLSFTIASNDIGSFWREGKIRYRWAPDGRR